MTKQLYTCDVDVESNILMYQHHFTPQQPNHEIGNSNQLIFTQDLKPVEEVASNSTKKIKKSSSKNKSSSSKKKKSSSSKLSWSQDNDEPHSQMLDPEAMKKTSSSILITKSQPLTQTNNMLTTQTDSFGASMSGASLLLPSRISYYNITQSKQDEENQAPNPSRDQCEEAPTFLFNRKTELSKRKKWSYGLVDAERKLSAAAANNDNNTTTSSSNKTSLPLLTMGTSLSNNNSAVADDDELNNDDSEISSSTSIGTSIRSSLGSFSSQNNISGGEIIDNHSLSQHLVHHKLPESVTSISSASSSSSASVAKPGGVGGSTSLSFPSQDHQSPSRHHYVKQRAVHASISSSSSLSESSVTNISNYSSGQANDDKRATLQQSQQYRSSTKQPQPQNTSVKSFNSTNNYQSQYHNNYQQQINANLIENATYGTVMTHRSKRNHSTSAYHQHKSSSNHAPMAIMTRTTSSRPLKESSSSHHKSSSKHHSSKHSKESRSSRKALERIERIERIELANNNSRNVLYGPSRDDDDADDVSWKMKEIIMQKQREKLNNYLRLQQNQLIAQQQHQAHDRFRSHHNVRKSSLNLSTSSSSSSFSSALSEQSAAMSSAYQNNNIIQHQQQQQQQQPPFLQSSMKPIALSYYHHLYNEKLMNSVRLHGKSSRRGVSTLQPALYKTTYVHHNQHQQSPNELFNSPHHNMFMNLMNHNAPTTNKSFKKEFSKKSSGRLTNTNSTNTNNTNNLNYSSTSTNGSGESIGSNYSLNNASNDIKHVKFRNYGLHKSLGENLNKITSTVASTTTPSNSLIPTLAPSAAALKTHNQSPHNRQHSVTPTPTSTTQLTPSSKSNRRSCNTATSNMSNRRRSPQTPSPMAYHRHPQHRSTPNRPTSKSINNIVAYDDEEDEEDEENINGERIYVNNRHYRTNSGHVTTSTSSGCGGDLLSDFVIRSNLQNQHDETPIATPTHKRRRELFEMPFKSCSPPRRRRGHFDADGESNAHYYNNHHSAEKTIGRAVSTFDNRCKYGVRSSRYEAPELITFIQSRLTNSRTEENDKSKFHIDFLNNSYETIFSTRTELVNKPIQMSIDTKNSGGGVVTAEIKLDDEPIKFDLVKMDDTRYELRLVPNRCGIYQVHMYLNMQPIKGSPFLIKIDSNGQVQAQPALNTTAGTNDYSSNTTTQITQISSLATSSNNLTSFTTTTTSSSATPLVQPSRTPQQQQKSPRKKSSDSSSSTARSVRLIRTELFDLTNQSDDLIAGEEVKLNVKILEYGSNDKLKKTISNIETKVKHNDKFISHKLELLPNGIYQIKFLPLKTGPYFVTFYKDGQKIDGSPYRLNIKGKFLKEMNKPNFGQVGVPYILDIEYCNTTNLDVNVSFVGRKPTTLDPSAQTVPSSPIAFEKSVESDVKLRVKFVPVNMGEHVIDILENGVSIEGFPVRVNVFHNRDAYLINENVNGTPLGSACKLSVVFDETPKNDIDIKITNLDSGEGQPITFLLNDEYDQIQHVFGAICKFLRIPASRMRNRELAVENGLTRVRFHLIETSKIATSYSKIDDASTTTTSSSSPNKQPRNSVIIADLREIIENDKFTIIDLSVHKTVRAVRDSLQVSPKGDRINTVSVTKNSNGRRFDIEFIPTVVGRYRLDIDSVPNAPYFINVFDPNGFKIVRRPDVLTLGTENIIEVNLSKCGFANFEAVILSPSGLKLPYKFDSNFAKRIRFIPTETGVHKISMKLGDRILNDHYLEINTRESQVPCVHGAGLFSGIQNVLSTFYVHVPAHIDGNLNIDILDPSSNTVKSYLKKLSDTLYEIKYLPMDVGEFKIVINYNDQQIESSPFRAQIVSLERVKMRESYSSSSQSRGDDSGSHFFSLVNNKILDLELEQERVLCFDTTEAGLGDLNVDILAPNNDKFPYRKIVVDPKGIFKIAFTPVYTGQYKIFVGFNNYQLSYSPVIARTLGYSIFNEIKVYGNGICNASLNEQAEFFVDCSRIKEMEECPEISFMGFSDDMNDLKINVTRIEENIYKCNYLPEKPGQYQINIKFNKTHISGSPFQVKIIQNEPPAVPGSSAIGPQISPSTSSSSSASKTDASKIIINKEEVRSAVVNQEIITHIDTRQAGAGGELTATCMGAQRSAQCEFVEQPDTPGVYALKILAHEVGKHVLQIKYNDEHVPGSPFTLRVSTPPDASKVEVFGPGICHGLLENYESKFVCDTRGAGAGQLTVRIRGPKGAFRVDMQRKDEKDRSIICKYDPLESGEYQINVKWSGKHVPNSPFNVHIFKTKEELDKFLAEQQPKEAFRLDEQTTVQNSNATTTSSSAALVNNKTSSSTKNTADNNNSSTTTSKEILVQRI